jgi:hypothetical protein
VQADYLDLAGSGDLGGRFGRRGLEDHVSRPDVQRTALAAVQAGLTTRSASPLRE